LFKIMTDDVDMRRRRALYRAMHRGTKEMDHLVGQFASVHVPGMTGEALSHFERAQGCAPEFAGLVKDVRRFHGLEDLGSANG
jgi:antitoxin CptB